VFSNFFFFFESRLVDDNIAHAHCMLYT